MSRALKTQKWVVPTWPSILYTRLTALVQAQGLSRNKGVFLDNETETKEAGTQSPVSVRQCSKLVVHTVKCP